MLAELAAIYRARKSAGLVISRASWLEEATSFGPVRVAPVVGGRTVWDGTAQRGWLHVVEQPNYFGRFETSVPEVPDVVTLQRLNGGMRTEEIIEQASAIDPVATGVARHLAGALNQLPGVKLPPFATRSRPM